MPTPESEPEKLRVNQHLSLGGGLCPGMAHCSQPDTDGQFPDPVSVSPVAETQEGPVTRSETTQKA